MIPLIPLLFCLPLAYLRIQNRRFSTYRKRIFLILKSTLYFLLALIFASFPPLLPLMDIHIYFPKTLIYTKTRVPRLYYITEATTVFTEKTVPEF